MNSDPNLTHNPRNPYSGRGFRKLPKFTRHLLPISAVFVLGGAAFSIKWSQDRRDNPCVDCNRQKEIAEEIYFGKKNKNNTSGSRI